MSTFDYSELAQTCIEMIAEFGRTCTIIAFNRTPADNAKPWEGPGEPRTSPSFSEAGSFCFVNAKSLTDLGFTLDTEEARTAEAYCLAASADFAADVENADELLDGSQRWKICYFDQLKPAETALIFVLALKR